MPKYKLSQTMMVQLEYAFKRQGDNQSDPFLVTFEQEAEFSFADSTDEPGIPGDPILLLQVLGTAQNPRYVLFRRQDLIHFSEDDDTTLSLDSAVAKFKFTLKTKSKSEEVVASYKIKSGDDRPRDQMPDGLDWTFMLTREDVDPPVFHLARISSGGPGGANPCVEWDCYKTTDLATKLKCLFQGCY